MAAPVISSIVSASTPPNAAGTDVTINGTGFGASPGSLYILEGLNVFDWTASIVSWSATEIVVTLPSQGIFPEPMPWNFPFVLIPAGSDQGVLHTLDIVDRPPKTLLVKGAFVYLKNGVIDPILRAPCGYIANISMISEVVTYTIQDRAGNWTYVNRMGISYVLGHNEMQRLVTFNVSWPPPQQGGGG